MKSRKSVAMSILVAMLIFSSSCSKKFLNQPDTINATQESLFKQPSDAVSLVSSIYNDLHGDNFIIKGLWYEANFLSQDWDNWGSDVFFKTYEIPTNFGGLEVLWDQAYNGISRANSALPVIAKMESENILSDSLAGYLRGQVYFLRGLYYYYLASEFGGVPLELNATTNGLKPRSTQDEVFESIVNDMDSAAALLPWREDEPSSDLGRATKGAAYAYMGSAQMWLKKYSDAVTTFEKLQGHYQLEQNFFDIFDFNNQNGKEDIFSIQNMAQPDMQNSSQNATWLNTFGMPEEVSATGYDYADPRLYNSFEQGDTRKLATVIGPGDPNPDPTINISSYPRVQQNFPGMNTCGTIANPWKGNDGERSGYYNEKYWRDPNVQSTETYIRSSENIILMRYGEVLISEAEALYKSGNEAAARDIINNQIRARARLGPTLAGENFEEVLLSEYRHELTGEFSLWFDLRRAGEGVHYVQENYDIAIPPGHDLMPIPEDQISANPNLVQNPGY